MFARTYLLVLAAALPARAPAQQTPMSAPARTVLSSPSVVVPLTKIGPFYFTNVRVNGREFQFTIETGASFFAISRKAANQLGLKIDSVEMSPGVTSPRVRIDSVNIGGVTLHGLVARIEPSFDGRTDDGVISVPMLRDLLWTLDLANAKLVLERGSLPPVNGRDVLAIVGADRGNRIDVPLVIAGQSVAAVLDSRYADWIVVSDSLMPRLTFAGEPRSAGVAWGPNQGTFEMRGARLTGDLTVGSYILSRPALVFRNRAGAVVGNGFLEQFAITVDQRNGRIRFQRNTPVVTMPPLAWEASESSAAGTTPRMAGATLKSGDRTFGFRLAARPNGPLSIVQLAPGSEAEKLGIRENDQVVEFVGKSAAEMNPGVFRAALARTTAVKVVVEREGKRVEFRVTPFIVP